MSLEEIRLRFKAYNLQQQTGQAYPVTLGIAAASPHAGSGLLRDEPQTGHVSTVMDGLEYSSNGNHVPSDNSASGAVGFSPAPPAAACQSGMGNPATTEESASGAAATEES